MRLEVTFAECAALVVFDPEEQTASWRYEPKSGKESIHIGPRVAGLDVPSIEMVLRHELLHRSMFHGFGEDYAHPELANLTLDVCINRLLFEAYPDQMRALALAIYPPESKSTPVALADCSADPAALPPELADLWQKIWHRGKDGSFAPLRVPSLYFKLLRLLEGGTLAPFVAFCKFHDPPKMPTELPKRVISAVANEVNKRLPRGSDLGRQLSDYSVVPASIGTSDVEAFLQRTQARRVATSTASKILAPLARELRVQPYPAFPSRMGLVYMLCGITDALGMYWNRQTANAGARLCIGIYMDVSGSMIRHFPLVAAFVDALKEVPLSVRTFDTVVRTIDVQDLARGNIKGGGGTDFDAPIRDMLDDRDISAGVLFTDGEGQLSSGLGRRLAQSGKKLYIVYLGATRPDASLHRFATDTITVPTA
jgi:hypothetical protein